MKTIIHRRTKLKYIIPQMLIDKSDRRLKMEGGAEDKREGYIRLYNKNSWVTEYYPIIRPSFSSFGWIVHGKPSDYFRNVITEVIDDQPE